MSTPLSSRASSWKLAGLPASMAFGASVLSFARDFFGTSDLVYRFSLGYEDEVVSRFAFSVVVGRVVPSFGLWLFAVAVAFSRPFDGRRGVRAARTALCALGVPWAVIVVATLGLFATGPWTMPGSTAFQPAAVIVLVRSGGI